MIILREKVKVPEKDIQEVVSTISNWFKNNPRRKVCYAGIFGYQSWKIRKKFLEQDVRDCSNVAKPYEK